MPGTLTGGERYQTYTQDLGWTEEQARRNIGNLESWLSMAAGGALMAAGIRQRSLLGAGLAAIGAALLYRGTTGHCAIYESLGVNTSDTSALGRRKVRTGRAIKVKRSIRVDRPAEDLFRFWRNFENLPRIMTHLESVQVINDRLSHWVVKALPALPRTVEWDAEIVNEVENELIGWRSLHDADVDNAGSVRFERTPDGRGTDVIVTLQYDPPAGGLGAQIAALLGEDPGRKIEEDLQRFKYAMEAEVRTT